MSEAELLKWALRGLRAEAGHLRGTLASAKNGRCSVLAKDAEARLAVIEGKMLEIGRSIEQPEG